jgi:hypothetical protein
MQLLVLVDAYLMLLLGNANLIICMRNSPGSIVDLLGYNSII